MGKDIPPLSRMPLCSTQASIKFKCKIDHMQEDLKNKMTVTLP
jgi:hypothetical protein